MRKRTRIFAMVSLLAGLLLGVGIFLATLAPASAHPAVDANAKKHHHTHTTTKTSTVTSTVTSTTTTTVTPPPPPSPLCFAVPNPAVIGSGTAGSGNPAGNVQFVLQCSNLNPAANYTLSWFFPTCTNGSLVVDGIATFIGNTGTQFVGRPDANGRIQANFQFAGCTPGTGNVNLVNNTNGATISTTVTLAPPSARHK